MKTAIAMREDKMAIEYIEREKAKRLLHIEYAYAAEQLLDEIPAADVAPVVHGRWEDADWIELEGGGNELIKTPNAALRCSNCRNCFKKKLLWKDAFCPNCGAKMDGGESDAAD